MVTKNHKKISPIPRLIRKTIRLGNIVAFENRYSPVELRLLRYVKIRFAKLCLLDRQQMELACWQDISCHA